MSSLGLGRPSSRPVVAGGLAGPSSSHLAPSSAADHHQLGRKGSSSRGSGGRRGFSGNARQASGGLFQTFTDDQVRQFRDAFSMIDTDADGKITEKDLEVFLGNLGKPASKSYIDALLSNKPSLTNNDEDDSYDIHQKPTSTSSAPRSLNFTQFLTMFCTHLLPFSTEQEMVDAFGCWDESDEGVLDIEEYRKWQKEWGTVSGDEEVERLFKSSFTDRKKGTFNYLDFAATLRIQDDQTLAAKQQQQQ